MPVVSQRKKLSTLDEESTKKMECSAKSQSVQSIDDVYDVLQSLSLLVLTGRQYEENHSSRSQVISDTVKRSLSLCIEVYGKAKYELSISSDYCDSDVLIEKWMLEAIPFCERKDLNPLTSIQFLTCAIKSFLYFSQINSWSISNGGNLPFSLVHRTYSANAANKLGSFEPFSPETHTFPLVLMEPQLFYIKIFVSFLPRLDSIPSQLLIPQPDFLAIDKEKNSLTKDAQLDKCDRTVVATGTAQTDKHIGKDDVNTVHPRNSCGSISSVFPFSPPNPSPLSHKVLSDPDSFETGVVSVLCTDTNEVLNRKDRATCESQAVQFSSTEFRNSCSSKRSNDINMNSKSQHQFSKCNSSRVVVSKLNRKCSDDTTYSSNKLEPAKPSALDSIQHTSKGVRPSGASSPIPFLLRRSTVGGLESSNSNDIMKKLKRRSCGVYSKSTSFPPLSTRSMSLPAVVPNLCLLGTFEESVLNGRIDPLGQVEGFTAELGASGSFCPQQITLPVSASFFSLSDDGGPSPYLGHVDLSAFKKGYRIPKKGTVQLTLFNPNKTVVKVFIIVYDHMDMPPNTNTFIRQKTLSRSSYAKDKNTLTLPRLQYLIHLRFVCSKSDHLYLHTDIKMLFARRAPDTDLDVRLYTLHEGPLYPKYGPVKKRSIAENELKI